MSLISVNDLTFSYDTNHVNIFENTSFNIDTDWKLGFIGRNGRGKTTFLNLLMGKFKYSGTITSSVFFDYFPFDVDTSGITVDVIRNIIAPFETREKDMEECIAKNTPESIEKYGKILDAYLQHDGYIINELIEKEIRKLDVEVDVLNRPFSTLSNGERTKLLLAALFLKKNNFLLIDEPTNHLDIEGRKVVANYLSCKKGFILVSHDRHFLDAVVDYIISINRSNIEIQKGNFSSWQDNKAKQDSFELSQNEKLKREISRLETAFEQTSGWSHSIEKTKYGSGLLDKGYIGHKAAKMMKRAKVIEKRQERLIDEKQQLLKNIEQADTLKIHPLRFIKSTLIDVQKLSLNYYGKILFKDLSFSVNQGDRIALKGKNGCGKSSIIKFLLGDKISYEGKFTIGSNLKISYVPQDTSFLKGSLKDFAQCEGIDESLFKAILRKLDFTRNSFDKDMSEYSEGQKKKVLIAKSLSQASHLYIWDEPLNFIDILSRIQIEELILKYQPTMIFVEHDGMFCENVATKTVCL